MTPPPAHSPRLLCLVCNVEWREGALGVACWPCGQPGEEATKDLPFGHRWYHVDDEDDGPAFMRA